MKQSAYADRLKIQRIAQIEIERRQAAEQALWLAVVALNETDGINLGPIRIARFAEKLNEVSEEYEALRREDTALAADKLSRRVDQIMGK